MPRLVPSQVVALIERFFPEEFQRRPEFQLARENSGQLVSIIELIEKIPQELITLDMPEYINLIVGNGTIRSAISLWQMHTQVVRGVPGYGGTSPITLIHQALRKCLDQFPSAETAELSFLQPDDLKKNLRLDISAMDGALANGDWKAATVLAGSVVEALLLWALQHLDSGKRATAITNALAGNLQQPPPTDLERWNLHQFIEVAAAGDVIAPVSAAQARLAKDFRNLIHLGRAARLGQMCDRGTALSAVAAVELVVRDLTL